MHYNFKITSKSGFTLIELMLSMALFSMVLVIVLGAFTQINAAFYRGVSSNKTQEAVRKLSDSIANDTRSNGLTLPALKNLPAGDTAGSNVAVICSDSSYFLIRENFISSDTERAAVKINGSGCGGAPTDFAGAVAKLKSILVDSATEKTEALISGNISVHGVFLNQGVLSLHTLYGDTSPTSGLVAYEDLAVNGVTKKIPRCAGGLNKGFQFCATAQMTTVLQNRLR
jgi:prepilin-type N-terminal cleavage/methylation domain-containing protein